MFYECVAWRGGGGVDCVTYLTSDPHIDIKKCKYFVHSINFWCFWEHHDNTFTSSSFQSFFRSSDKESRHQPETEKQKRIKIRLYMKYYSPKKIYLVKNEWFLHHEKRRKPLKLFTWSRTAPFFNTPLNCVTPLSKPSCNPRLFPQKIQWKNDRFSVFVYPSTSLHLDKWEPSKVKWLTKRQEIDLTSKVQIERETMKQLRRYIHPHAFADRMGSG